MKTILIAIAAAVTFSTTASAWEGHYYAESSSCRPVRHCEVYKVSTCEVNRCCHTKVAYDHCGRPYRYSVTVVTYRNYYSDGSSNTFTRSYRS